MLAGEVIQAGRGYSVAVPPFDFETYSEAGFKWNPIRNKWDDPDGAPQNKRGLPVVGRRAYIKHPSFEVLSLAWDLLDGKGPRHWKPSRGMPPWKDDLNGWFHPDELLRYVARRGMLEAWNSGFEFDVWNEYCVPQWGWPPLVLEQTRCAMAKARVSAYPGKLAESGKVLRLTNQKDADGDRLLKLFSVPRNPTKTNSNRRLLPEDLPEEAKKLYAYNRQDIVSEAEASARVPDQSPEELEIWLTDQKINLRGIQVDLVGVDNCIAIVEQAHAKYNAELKELTGGAVAEASELPKIKEWARTQGAYFDSLREEILEELLADRSKLPPKVYRALEIRQLIGSASVKKLYAFRLQNVNGRLYDLYGYFVARTGRWAGNGPQPQNLPKGIFKTLAEVERALQLISYRSLELIEFSYPGHSALDIVSSCLRGLLIAAPGMEFICSDYSAIEGVVTAALAGEEWRLEVFRTHGLNYEASAAATTGVQFEEFVEHRLSTGGVLQPDGSINGGKHHPLRNQIGKYTELACGFGGWVGAMVRFGADEFLDEKQMKDAILAWRKASPMIVNLWGGQRVEVAPWTYKPLLHGLEGAAISAIENAGIAFGYRGIIYQMSVTDDILYCRVPSGGFLTYHRPRLEPSTRQYASPWEREVSFEGWNNDSKKGPIGWIRMMWYGGLGTENVVQKEARAVHANGLVNLERANYRVVLHSHDEPCGEVPMGWGDITEFESLMTKIVHTPGTFCYGWPIKAKGGWRGPRYGKFD